MAGLGIIIGWAGYWVAYYGITQVQGGNWGLLDLGIPGRWTATVAATPKDGGTVAGTSGQVIASTAPAGSSTVAGQPGGPVTASSQSQGATIVGSTSLP